jgi:ribonuclease-3
VESKALAARMQQWDIASQIRMSVGEEAGGGRQSQSILEDVCEALIGAVYLDGGFAAAYQLIERHWKGALHQQAEAPKDAKSALQELAQGKGLPLPEYQLVSAEGPAHEPYFTVSVTVQGYPPQQGEAPSKRKAEQEAAAKMLDIITQ